MHPGLQRKENIMAKRLRTESHYAVRWILGIAGLSLGLLVAGVTLIANLAFAKTDDAETTLLVWAGDQAHQAPDFVAVIDFDADSPTYGRILHTVPLPGPSAIGNEPHHVGLSTGRAPPHGMVMLGGSAGHTH